MLPERIRTTGMKPRLRAIRSRGHYGGIGQDKECIATTVHSAESEQTLRMPPGELKLVAPCEEPGMHSGSRCDLVSGIGAKHRHLPASSNAVSLAHTLPFPEAERLSARFDDF